MAQKLGGSTFQFFSEYVQVAAQTESPRNVTLSSLFCKMFFVQNAFYFNTYT